MKAKTKIKTSPSFKKLVEFIRSDAVYNRICDEVLRMDARLEVYESSINIDVGMGDGITISIDGNKVSFTVITTGVSMAAASIKDINIDVLLKSIESDPSGFYFWNIVYLTALSANMECDAKGFGEESSDTRNLKKGLAALKNV